MNRLPKIGRRCKAASNTPQRTAQPTVTPQPERQVTRNDSPEAQPQPPEAEAKDIPVALVTSALARPIARSAR